MKNQTKRTKWNAIGGAAMLAMTIAGCGYLFLRSDASDVAPAYEMPVFEVKKGPLKISVVESGTVRPREQIILKNEMNDPSTILYIVEEGSSVKRGDLLVELDASAQEREHHTKLLEVQNDEAEFISAKEELKVVHNQAEADIEQAEMLLDFANQDLKKYVEGDYPKLLKEAEANLTLAEEELNRAEEALKWSAILYKDKYLSHTEYKQDELAAKKARLNLELAMEDLKLLRNYTYHRQVSELESKVWQSEMALDRAKNKAAANIIQASATFKAREADFEEESDELRELEQEIKKAKIHAPIDGVVLYASSVRDEWDTRDDRIREGAIVEERGEIIYLPTASSYNVDIQIQETDLNKVRPGLPVDIAIDAMPGEHFTGIVKSIASLPDQGQRYLNPNLKVYNTEIEIDGDTATLRNGMSCLAEIVVEEHEDVYFVPIQSVVKVDRQTRVYVKQPNRIVAKPVEIGLDNKRMVHILEGVEEGDLVLLKPPLNPVSQQVPEQPQVVKR